MDVYDITGIILQARRNADRWPDRKFFQLIEELRRIAPTLRFDFDLNAGEKWASFHADVAAVAFIRFDFPLAIVTNVWHEVFIDIFHKYRVEILSVPDMVCKQFRLDRMAIPQLFPDSPWSPVINPDCFSIGDLWYTTIT